MKDREALNRTAAEPGGEWEEVEKIIGNIQAGLTGDSAKPSVTDLARLLELRRELARPQTERLRVRWIDECQPTPACEE